MTFRLETTGTADIERGLQAYLGRLERDEQRAWRGMTRAYREAFAEFESAAYEMGQRIQQAQAAGQPVSASWLFQQERYQRLQQAAAAGLAQFAPKAGDVTLDYERAALADTARYIEGIARTAYGAAAGVDAFAVMPADAIASFVGMSRGADTVLQALFMNMAGAATVDGSRMIQNTLVQGLARGTPSRVLARRLTERIAGLALPRAFTVARTETARARRSGTLIMYQRHSRVFSGWVWRAALVNSCPACIAMHGQEFPNNTMQYGHPNCRCNMVPIVGDRRPDLEDPERWLLSRYSEWDRIFGRGRATWLRTMTENRVMGLREGLTRMASWHPNPRWGGMYRPTTLRDLRRGSGLSSMSRLSGTTPVTRTPWNTTAPRGAQATAATRPTINATMRERGLQQFTRRWSLTAQELQQVRARIYSQLNGARLTIRRSQRSAELIVRDGRFKSQFETGRSGGALSPSARAEAEKNMFDVPVPAGHTGAYRSSSLRHSDYNAVFPGEQRPIYGYLVPRRPDSEWRDAATWYGDVQFVLKDSVRKKATWTNGDSLGESYTPAHFDDPTPEVGLNAQYSEPRQWRIGENGYTEIQVHGGTFLDDVDYVILPRGASASLKQALDDRGVRWEEE